MRYALLGMLLLFALGDACSPPPNVVGVQDFGRVAGRVLDAMTNRPIPNALLSVGSLYTTRADVNGAFTLRTVAGDQTVTARAPGYSTTTADTTIPKDGTVSVGYIRLVPLTYPGRSADARAAADADPSRIAGCRDRRARLQRESGCSYRGAERFPAAPALLRDAERFSAAPSASPAPSPT